MKQVVIVGSLNIDLVMQVARRPQPGETIIGESFNTFVGGKGNNQALAAARAGAQVVMIGKVGCDSFAETISKKLEEAGVNIQGLLRDPETTTGVADILVDATGENSICIAPQANGKLSPADIAQAEPLISSCGIMLLQLEIPMPTVISAAQLAKKHGLTVILNPAPAPKAQLPPELLSCIDILIPNQTEAELLTGLPAGDLLAAMEAGTKLQKQGIKQVLITMGEQGTLVVAENKVATMIPSFVVEAVDSTAAGDAFCGAFAAALAQESNLEKAVTFGCAAGALAATKLGAEPSLPQQSEIEKLAQTYSHHI
ncbi:MAG: ribokinase [Candidatus Obscuribacterales bacterium]|nr:ribokinase [Candidatus Obscuribacterales bacterium]